MPTNANGDGEIDQPAGVAKDATVVDVSMPAVNARLRQFIAEVRERPEGDERPSDRLLAAWAEDALVRQEAAELKLAEVERLRGGRLQ